MSVSPSLLARWMLITKLSDLEIASLHAYEKDIYKRFKDEKSKNGHVSATTGIWFNWGLDRIRYLVSKSGPFWSPNKDSGEKDVERAKFERRIEEETASIYNPYQNEFSMHTCINEIHKVDEYVKAHIQIDTGGGEEGRGRKFLKAYG